MGIRNKNFLIIMIILSASIFVVTLDADAIYVKKVFVGGVVTTIGTTIHIHDPATPPDGDPSCGIQRNCFIPNSLVIKTGDTVTWVNYAATAHQIKSGEFGDPQAGSLFDITVPASGSATHTFTQSGLVHYHHSLPAQSYETGRIYVGPHVGFNDDNYFVGNSGAIAIIDVAANNPAIEDKVSVTISSQNAGHSFTFDVGETGLDTGVFVKKTVWFEEDNGINTNFPGAPNSATSILVDPNDIVDVIYTDTASNSHSDSITIMPNPTSSPYPIVGSWQGTVALQCTSDGEGGGKGDGVCDDWENNPTGIIIDDPTLAPVPYSLNCNDDRLLITKGLCPDIDVYDIFVEVDWMENHEPQISTLLDVVAAFQAQNINLHIQLDEEIPYMEEIPVNGTPQSPGFSLWLHPLSSRLSGDRS